MEAEQFRKLFIGGLSYETTEDSLKGYFAKWGNIVDSVVMRDGNTKRSRGFGFVTYDSLDSVDQVQANRPHVIDKKEVETKRATPREESGKPEAHMTIKKVFVGGLKDDVEDEHLRDYFSKFGAVMSVDLILDKETRRKRGFAFVSFDDYDPVDKLCLEKDHRINGKRADVRKALDKKDAQNMGNRGGMGGRGGGRGAMRGGNTGGRWNERSNYSQNSYGNDGGYGGGNYGGGTSTSTTSSSTGNSGSYSGGDNWGNNQGGGGNWSNNQGGGGGGNWGNNNQGGGGNWGNNQGGGSSYDNYGGGNQGGSNSSWGGSNNYGGNQGGGGYSDGGYNSSNGGGGSGGPMKGGSYSNRSQGPYGGGYGNQGGGGGNSYSSGNQGGGGGNYGGGYNRR